MTPPAATVAGRATEPPPRSRARTAGGLAEPPRSTSRTTERTHRRPVRPSGPVPRQPRRVSGPAGGTVAVPGPVSPPAKKPASRRAPAETRPKQPAQPLSTRALAYLRALPDHRWLDRLVRGRAWIPVLGVLLVGIVAIQVEVLKLGTSIGRSMNLAAQLQSRNELLRASVSQLSDDQRIMRQAAKLGMVMPGPTEENFVPAHGAGNLSKAIAGLTAPDPQAFLSALAAEESSDGVANPTLGSSGTPVPPDSPAGAAAPTAGATTSTPAATATTTTTAPSQTTLPATTAPAVTAPTTTGSTGGTAG